MLTLKFIKEDNLGRHVEVGLDCATYEAIQCDDGYLITAYKTFTHADGVEYTLDATREQDNCYRICFVINEQGKTIDKYTAIKPETITK